MEKRYKLEYFTKGNNRRLMYFDSLSEVEEQMMRLFRRRVECEVWHHPIEKEKMIGQIYYTDRPNTKKWHWYLDNTEKSPTDLTIR